MNEPSPEQVLKMARVLRRAFAVSGRRWGGPDGEEQFWLATARGVLNDMHEPGMPE